MIEVRVILHSARTGQSTVLGRTYITNDGTGTTDARNYDVAIARKGDDSYPPRNVTRRARVERHAAERLPIWILVLKALRAAYGGG